MPRGSRRTPLAKRPVLGHVAEHDLGAAAYAIRAAQAAEQGSIEAGARECEWQRQQLPEEVRSLVLEDQNRRRAICWNVFTN
ncbi:putative immunity protein [Ornithinimicrobium panacihumi]|uniref:putative immunity protein n=1 Tax=Ornithinimicrobium panacihumi TaxID=2008449 RepID=UPI003F8BF20C